MAAAGRALRGPAHCGRRLPRNSAGRRRAPALPRAWPGRGARPGLRRRGATRPAPAARLSGGGRSGEEAEVWGRSRAGGGGWVRPGLRCAAARTAPGATAAAAARTHERGAPGPAPRDRRSGGGGRGARAGGERRRPRAHPAGRTPWVSGMEGSSGLGRCPAARPDPHPLQKLPSAAAARPGCGLEQGRRGGKSGRLRPAEPGSLAASPAATPPNPGRGLGRDWELCGALAPAGGETPARGRLSHPPPAGRDLGAPASRLS